MAKNDYTIWTLEDTRFIITHWKAHKDEWIASRLDRTVRSVRNKRNKLGCTKRKYYGTGNYEEGIPYQKALPRDCWPRMERFLNMLKRLKQKSIIGNLDINLRALKAAHIANERSYQ